RWHECALRTRLSKPQPKRGVPFFAKGLTNATTSTVYTRMPGFIPASELGKKVNIYLRLSSSPSPTRYTPTPNHNPLNSPHVPSQQPLLRRQPYRPPRTHPLL